MLAGQAKEIKQRMLNWAKQFSIFVFLDSNNYPSNYNGYECLLAAGVADTISGDEGDLLTSLQDKHNEKKDWFFGHICYDYKNILEPRLVSSHRGKTGFPLLHFFIPQTVCYLNKEQTILTIESFDDPGAIYKEINEMRQNL